MTIKTKTLEHWVQTGLIILVALMPFHAFLSVWIGSITHHQAIVQAWKELLLLALAALVLVIAWREPEARDRLRTWPVLMAGLFAIIAVLVTLFTRPSLTAIAFGAKTDLESLVAFVLALIVARPKFENRLTMVVVIPAILVVVFGLLEVYALPPRFLTHFGYGPSTIVPYETLGPAVKSLRFPSTLGGPNQLGTYLMLPAVLAALMALRRRRWWWLALTAGAILMLVHTYSRAAWLGALCAAVVLILGLIPTRTRYLAAGAVGLLALIAAVVIDRLIKSGSSLAHYLLHSSTSPNIQSSDTQHLSSLRQGLSFSLERPLGHGLGTAGPTFFHTGQGIIIENYYLQLSYETGLAGLIVFALLLAATARELAHRATHHDLAAAALAAIVGISVTSLFLPAWTDSSTAIIVWAAAGAAIGQPGSKHV